MSPLEVAVRIVVDLLVRGEFSVVEALTRSCKLTAAELEEAVLVYGRTLVPPPNGYWQVLDIIAVDEADVPTYSVVAPLWTEEEGRSDLSLVLTMTEFAPGLFATQIDGLYVR
ncbi:MAG: hypothetical protein HY828_07300 [Actinobacteria bacterium]|nr:hypothetical protein [Actinomycetota bacterium]